MPIPSGITANHILTAIQRIDKEGVPVRRGPRKWAVKYNTTLYPCKLLISWGHKAAFGKELIYNRFISDEARPYLTNLHYQVVPYKK